MPSGIALGMLLAPPLLAVAGWRALWTVAFCFTVAAMALLVAQRRRYDGAPASGGATFADVGGVRVRFGSVALEGLTATSSDVPGATLGAPRVTLEARARETVAEGHVLHGELGRALAARGYELRDRVGHGGMGEVFLAR